MNSRWLIVFLKAPRPGFVKTRLAKEVGAERACEIYQKVTNTVLKQLAEMSAAVQVQLRYTPDDATDEIKRLCHDGWSMQAQGTGDLGERLRRAFSEAFTAGAESVVIIGSDCPDVREKDIHQACDELARHDVVLGRAVDGGYWLIALSRPQPELFTGISWGSAYVFNQTIERVRCAGLSVHLLRTLRDIDTVEDWNWWLANRS